MNQESASASQPIHSPPQQMFSDEAANEALILALGIMVVPGIILIIAIALSAFYLTMSPDGTVVGGAIALIIFALSSIFPISIAIHFVKKRAVKSA